MEPGGNAWAIELQQLFGVEARRFAGANELVLGVAAAMSQNFVERAEECWTIRDQDDRSATGS